SSLPLSHAQETRNPRPFALIEKNPVREGFSGRQDAPTGRLKRSVTVGNEGRDGPSCQIAAKTTARVLELVTRRHNPPDVIRPWPRHGKGNGAAEGEPRELDPDTRGHGQLLAEDERVL